MARIVKEYAVRRDELLDTAEQLMYSKGYERMSVQDILDTLNLAKGTFYHYFDSKQALLEAVIERIIDRVEVVLTPIVTDADLLAGEKFERFFFAQARWKTEHKSLLLELLKIWYTDENVLVRQKMTTLGLARIGPLLDSIIQQGMREGVWRTDFPDQISDIVLALGAGLNEALAALLLAEPTTDQSRRMKNTTAAYTNAIERVLDAAPDTLRLVDTAELDEWIVFQAQRER
jgi:AcrR family transcriptional regulator